MCMSNSKINPYQQMPAPCLYLQKSKYSYLRASLFILLIGFFNAISAQEIRINGDVINALTLEGINRATVSLMTTDSSTVLATDSTRYRIVTEKGDNWENNQLCRQIQRCDVFLYNPSAKSLYALHTGQWF